ncbi:hypothetical protein WA026_015293 [Henosepilachna vigintioctopunctata]|uniref:CID domain-containing protein n=1 Tax=Henosepilachna vigintioctopunctata TaxID=420089 RepID=A0AAW1TUE2_9CUCU
MDKAVKQFGATLQELASEKNALIFILTSLAKDHVSFAAEIVTVVEDHITKVEPFSKVLTIQLIDSIVKNVGGTYINLFGRNIGPTFCRVYYEADTECQFSMIRLRKTWNGIFSSEVLRYIDRRVREPELILIPIRLSTKRRRADEPMECGDDSKYDKIYESRNIVKRYRPLPTDDILSQSNEKKPRIDHTIENGYVSNGAENTTFCSTANSSFNRITSEVNERLKNLRLDEGYV